MMNKALLASCALVGTLALASIAAQAECIDRAQAFREYRHLADGALPCNNGKGVQMIDGEAVRAKPTPEEQRTLNRLTAHPELPRSEKDRIREQTERASSQRGAAMMFAEGEQRAHAYRSCMALKSQ
jgi:hypothetical protein